MQNGAAPGECPRNVQYVRRSAVVFRQFLICNTLVLVDENLSLSDHISSLSKYCFFPVFSFISKQSMHPLLTIGLHMIGVSYMSVRPSVCVSHTHYRPIKRTQTRITKSSPSPIAGKNHQENSKRFWVHLERRRLMREHLLECIIPPNPISVSSMLR